LHQALPLAFLTGVSVFQARLYWQGFRMCNAVSIRGGVAFSRLAEKDNALIVACQNGDINQARQALVARKGFVEDLTEGQLGPMALSRVMVLDGYRISDS
jgi:stage V sporulation protein SpoVS